MNQFNFLIFSCHNPKINFMKNFFLKRKYDMQNINGVDIIHQKCAVFFAFTKSLKHFFFYLNSIKKNKQ